MTGSQDLTDPAFQNFIYTAGESGDIWIWDMQKSAELYKGTKQDPAFDGYNANIGLWKFHKEPVYDL